MRFLVLFILMFTSQLFAANCIYKAGEYVIRLKSSNQFVFYPAELSLKTNVSGEYQMRKDSLILSTHEGDNETAIFAIYVVSEREVNLAYAQLEYEPTLPKRMFLLKELFENSRAKTNYIWTDHENGDYQLYNFNEEGAVLSIYNFENNLLEGKQVIFFDNAYAAVKQELQYRQGELHGKSYYYEPVDEEFYQVALIKEERYKKGKLVKTKTPGAQQVFYTSHF